MITLKLKVVSTYIDEAYAQDPELDEDGSITEVKTVELPLPPQDEASEEFDDWLREEVKEPYCGTGRPIGKAFCDIEVLETSDPSRIPAGTKWDDGY